MNLAGDMPIFFADFGVPATYAGVTETVLLDAADSMGSLQGLEIISADAMMTYPSAIFSALDEGDSITVDGRNYAVKASRPIDDGALSVAYLRRTA